MQCQAASFDLPSSTWQPSALPALDSARTLVLGFGAPELADDPRVFEELAKAYPRSLIIGCSSAGEIHGTTLRDHSLALTVTRFDKTDLQLASLEISSAADSHKAGVHLAKKLSTKPGLRAVLILSEGLHVNGSELVRGLSASLPPTVVVTGGLSADGPRFHRTWVAIGPRVASDVIAAVGFYGDHLVIGHGSKGGWDKFGPERLVTHSQGNVLFELDGRPALALYKEYLGDKAKDLPASGLLFPLSIRSSSSDDKPVVRTLLSVDHDRQSLTFAGDIPKGHLAQLMKADFDRLIDGAGVAGSLTLDSARPPKDADSLVIAISCVGRRLVLGARTEEEIEAVRDAVRSDRAHITGFYSYGEISPFASGSCDLHNQTMTLTLLSEAQTPVPRAIPATPGALALGKLPTPPRPTQRPVGAAAAPRPQVQQESAVLAAVVPPRPPVAFPTVKTSIADDLSQPLPLASQPPPATGTVVRLPPPPGGDATVEISEVGALQLVRLRGRINEAFKGEQLGRTLGPRVVFDLGEVDRVTSFGVREWLAMLAAATRVTEVTFVRCSEAIVNQLTMIRKFDGGARIASFFMPYLCDECGATLECLRDCQHDAAELSSYAPNPVRCPRCDGEARFDDDARSYFAFAAPHFGAALPAEVRALADSLARQTAAPPTEEIEKLVDREATRVRVLSRLTAQLRWRKIFDGIEGALTIDLSTAPACETAGLANLDEALRALPAEVAPICIEHAPPALVERLAKTPSERVRVVSAAAAGYCPSCAVNRPALVHLDRLAEDLAAGREHKVMCKRCNGPLALSVDAPLRTLLERSTKPAPSAAPAVALPAPMALPARRGISPGVVALLVTLAAAIGALAILLRSDRGAASQPAAQPLAAAVAPAPAPQRTAWSAASDLPPEWTERELVLEGEELFIVGRAHVASENELGNGLESARRAATARLVRQLQSELEGSPVLSFVAARSRPDTAANEEAIAARFEAQHGKELALARVDTATRRTPEGVDLYARYRVPRAQYQAVLARYRATYSFRGLEAALFFPTLEGTLHATGQLVVIGVERRSLAAAAGVREGDVILSVGSTPVSSLESLRATAAAAWTELAPRGRLAIELESAGALKVIHMTRPAPLQP